MKNTFLGLAKSWKDTADEFLEGGILTSENIIMGAAVITVAIFIQIFFPPGTRTVSRRAWVDNYSNFFKYAQLGIWGTTIPSKYLKVYRCPSCNKLLAKGNLAHKDDLLEVKCRGCSTICLFRGEDADIIEKRSKLLEEGLIPDPDRIK